MSEVRDVPAAKPLSYMPQLDGLRALCIFAVIVVHYMPESHWMHLTPLAGIGVRCFFVLSGYLITEILLKIKREAGHDPAQRLLLTRNFYIRRSLRIFPVYYLTLLVIYALDVQHARESIGWTLTYTVNFYFAMREVLLWSIAHFWSLSVEEQFYIVWPWLIVWTPPSRLMGVILATIATGPLFHVFCRLQGPEWYVAMGTLPFGNLDALGLGAFFALCDTRNSPYAKWAEPIARAGIWIGLPLFAVFAAMRYAGLWPFIPRVLSSFVLTLALGWAVYRSARGFGGWLGKLLEWRPLRYIGRISYGMYINHVFMLLFAPWLLRQIGLNMPGSLTAQFLIMTAFCIATASLTWHLFEKPLNNLKRRFPC